MKIEIQHPPELNGDWDGWECMLMAKVMWDPDVVKCENGVFVVPGSFFQLLLGGIEYIIVVVVRFVAEVVGGVVNGINGKGDECELFSGADVGVAK